MADAPGAYGEGDENPAAGTAIEGELLPQALQTLTEGELQEAAVLAQFMQKLIGEL